MKNKDSVRGIQELIKRGGTGRGLSCSALDFGCLYEIVVEI